MTSTPCRHCGDPLPPRKPGRGRPAVTHSGECRRLYVNRRNLNYRIERFRQAHRLVADRSDSVSWASPRYASDDVSFEENVVPVSGAFDDVHGKGLMAAVDRWEKAESAHRTLLQVKHILIQGERQKARQRASEKLASLSQEDRAALVRKAVAARLARRHLDD